MGMNHAPTILLLFVHEEATVTEATNKQEMTSADDGRPTDT